MNEIHVGGENMKVNLSKAFVKWPHNTVFIGSNLVFGAIMWY